LAADQQVTTAQGTLESAQSAVQTAQQTLTTAQETLVSATSALQEAESAVEVETQQKAELIRVAEEAVQQAEQNLQTAEKELDAARMALREVKPFSLLPINPKSFASDFEEEYNSIDVLANSQRSRNALKRFIDDIDATNQELQRTIIPLRKERDKLDNNVGKIVERLRLTSIINERQNVQSFVNLIFIALEGGSAGGGSFRTPSHESILDLIREFTRRSKINGPGNPFETIYFENSQR
jgi:DNA repair exonuclease SbcCD ATPase subunit